MASLIADILSVDGFAKGFAIPVLRSPISESSLATLAT
jgi:hypothetical protein